MDHTDEESPSTSEKTFPAPPPYPCYASSIHRPKGLLTNGSPCRGHHCARTDHQNAWDRLFDEAHGADVLINTDHSGVIYAHASILGIGSPVLRGLLQQKRRGCGHKRSISIRGVPPEAVHVFIRYLYSSCFDEQKLEEYVLQLLVLSHAYAVPHLKRVCEQRLEQRLMTSENAIDVFQISLLCDAPRLSLICHRFILRNFKAVSATDGWKSMRKSHPVLEQEILASMIDANDMQKERIRKVNERKVYLELYEAMEALVHLCRDGSRSIGLPKKFPREHQGHCQFEARKGLQLLLRHFGGCKKRVPGGCVHCKRMWQLLELHSHLCADSETCLVPLCRDFKQRRQKQNKKVEIRWRILVKKIVRSKSISGAPFFSLEPS